MKNLFTRLKSMNLPLVLITLCSFFLRLYIIKANKSFWLDEAMIYHFSTKNSFLQLISGNYYDFAEHPFLNYILLKGWAIISVQEAWLRVLPVIFAVGNTICLYLIGKNLGGKLVGYTASFFFAINAYHIFHGTEIKYYQLTLFFQLISFLCLIKALDFNKLKFWGLFGFFNFLSFVGDYSSVWYLGSVHIFLLIYIIKKFLIKKDKMKNISLGLIFSVTIFTLFSFYWVMKLFSVLSDSLMRQAYLVPPTLDKVITVVTDYLTFNYWMGQPFVANAQLFYSFFAFFLVSCIVIYVLAADKIRYKSFLVFWCFLPIIFSYTISQRTNIFIDYNLMSISVPLIFFLALLACSNKKYFLFISSTYVLMNTISIHSSVMYNSLQDWRSLFQNLPLNSINRITFYPDYLKYPFLYYLDQSDGKISYTSNLAMGAETFEREKKASDRPTEKCIVTMENERNPQKYLNTIIPSNIQKVSYKFNGVWQEVQATCVSDNT